MHRIGAALARGSDVFGGVQVRADLHGGVGGAGVQRATIVSGHDRNGGDPLGAAGTKDPQRDLTAVRYEQALHRGDSNRRPCANRLEVRYPDASL